METQRLNQLKIGKVVAHHTYIHIVALQEGNDRWNTLVNAAASLAQITKELDFNVIKFRHDSDEVSLLKYDDFFEVAFPVLAKSWRINLSTKSVTYRTYEDSQNPPILHRKELLIPYDHPRIPEYRALTDTAEMLGFFDDNNRIGFYQYWHELVNRSGYEIRGHEIIPIANDTLETTEKSNNDYLVERHLTALSRSNFSAPVQALLRHRLLDSTRTFFDYGCGKGDDVRGLIEHGIDATGWDPHFALDRAKRSADIVNIGFVINVIEDVSERVEALTNAFSYTQRTLSVAAMLSSRSLPDGHLYRDGYLTKRNTFQKYYSQQQLRDFIEHTLDEQAIAVGPGVFFVFRDKSLEQQFLSARYGSTSRQKRHICKPQLRLKHEKVRKTTSHTERVDRRAQFYEEHSATLSEYWAVCLNVGRKAEEVDLSQQLLETIKHAIGSINKAFRIASTYFSKEELFRRELQQRSDLITFAALQQFEKRKPYRKLEEKVQRQIRHFFGDYTYLQTVAKSELFKINSLDELDLACKEAANKGYGWLNEGHSLQLHVSLIERLPSLLRVYVGCATAVFGDIFEYDLVKIHIRSAKLSLLKFNQFGDKPIPELIERVKINLKTQDFDVFKYGDEYPPPLLFYKSRYINEENLHYAAQIEFEQTLEQIMIFDLSNYGPSAQDFAKKLSVSRWEIDGYQLRRSTTIPDINDPCGSNFTYRHFIECGETQLKQGIDNLPGQPDTYTALYDLATQVLDPVIDYFGGIKLTYGFCSHTLAKSIRGRIAPKLDQHACHELNNKGTPICDRLGAACDFIVEDEDMEEVSKWISLNTPFDRLYYYGKDKPIHVSYSTTPTRQFVRMVEGKSGRLIPKIDKLNRP